jgi:hypothetical protein
MSPKVGLFEASITVARFFILALALSIDFESGGSNNKEKDCSEFHFD